ncbi:hypothetical protein MATL_G00072510 [Megalops atlanticus]|uniref:Uncharacterized protein n=1 Tax=Megalops atlanticus TaxID=7932 RepID=A0A9D3TC34_MEGAT|nr:hypothetical protein MATL_G00072510 [Megalops atlanticus]
MLGAISIKRIFNFSSVLKTVTQLIEFHICARGLKCSFTKKARVYMQHLEWPCNALMNTCTAKVCLVAVMCPL